MMRKNVVKKPRKNSAQSAMGTRQKLDEEEEKIETTAPEAEVLTLPTIALKNQKKQRPGSMNNRREEDMLISPPILPSNTEEVKSSHSNRSRKKSFMTKVIKMNSIDHSIREREEKEAAEKEKQEREERRYANGILMQHGITQAEGRIVSRKANQEFDKLEKTVHAVEGMIGKYEAELVEFKHRLQELEMAELARIE